jgi:hypothetical protein
MEYIKEAIVVPKINNSENNSAFVNVIAFFMTFVLIVIVVYMTNALSLSLK